MVAYTEPQQRKKEERESLRREREIRSSLLILTVSCTFHTPVPKPLLFSLSFTGHREHDIAWSSSCNHN